MKRALAAVASGLALLAGSGAGAATICVTPPAVTTCANHTIQAGVNLAGPGDIVKVAAGVYYEAVTVPPGKNNLQIVGAGKTRTIIDPDLPNVGNGITVASDGVKITTLGIRNGTGAGIRVTGSNAVISGVRVVGLRGAVEPGIYVIGGNSQVLGSEVRACAREGIVAVGDDNVVKLNTLSQIFLRSIVVLGNNNQVVSNKVTNAGVADLPSNYGIQVLAGPIGKNVVSGNILENVGDGRSGSYGLYVSDPEPTVQANKLTWAGTVWVECANCNGGMVALNSVLGSPERGFLIKSTPLASPAARLLVQGNKSGATRWAGFEIRGSAGLSPGQGIGVQKNAASETAHPSNAFHATGSGHTFVSNTAINSGGAGFYARGDNLRFQSNVATKSTSSGFVVDGGGVSHSGATLSANRAVGSVGQGFALYDSTGGGFNPTGTTGALNTGLLNRQDFCNEGAPATIGTFATTSTTCDIRQ